MNSPARLRQRRTLRRGLTGGWVVFAVAALAGGLVGLTAANSVGASRIGDVTAAVTPDDLAPAECLPGTRTYTNVVNGGGTAGADLVLGTAAGETLAGGDGDDCILGGGGNDVLQGQGGNDRYIGGPGSDRQELLFGTCEYFED